MLQRFLSWMAKRWPFVFLIQSAGLHEQEVPKKFIRIKEKVRVPNDAWAQVSPFDGFKVAFTGVWDHPVHKDMEQKLINFNSTRFKRSQQSKDFWSTGSRSLKENNLLGASQKNAIAIGEESILNEDGLRLENEMMKHKILDAIGDLYLLGHNLAGSFEGYKSGHTANNALLRELIASLKLGKCYTTTLTTLNYLLRSYN